MSILTSLTIFMIGALLPAPPPSHSFNSFSFIRVAGNKHLCDSMKFAVLSLLLLAACCLLLAAWSLEVSLLWFVLCPVLPCVITVCVNFSFNRSRMWQLHHWSERSTMTNQTNGLFRHISLAQDSIIESWFLQKSIVSRHKTSQRCVWRFFVSGRKFCCGYKLTWWTWQRPRIRYG